MIYEPHDCRCGLCGLRFDTIARLEADDLRRLLADARKDTERLDWLQQHLGAMMLSDGRWLEAVDLRAELDATRR